MSADDLKSRTHLVENEIRIMRSEIQRISHAIDTLTSHVKENTERIKVSMLFIVFPQTSCHLKCKFKLLFSEISEFLPSCLLFPGEQNTAVFGIKCR